MMMMMMLKGRTYLDARMLVSFNRHLVAEGRRRPLSTALLKIVLVEHLGEELLRLWVGGRRRRG